MSDKPEHTSNTGEDDLDQDQLAGEPGHGRSDELTDGEPTVADEAGLDPDNDGEVDSPTPTAATSGSADPEGDDGDERPDGEEKPLEDVAPDDRDAQGPQEATRDQRAQQMPDELKVDVDQEKLRAWEEVRGEYGVKEGAERPIMTGEGDPEPVKSTGGEGEDHEVDADKAAGDDRDHDGPTGERERDRDRDGPDQDRSSEEPTDGQTT